MLLFIILGVYFAYLLHEGITTGQVKGKDYGFRPARYYTKEDSPFTYWSLIFSYTVIVLMVSYLSLRYFILVP